MGGYCKSVFSRRSHCVYCNRNFNKKSQVNLKFASIQIRGLQADKTHQQIESTRPWVGVRVTHEVWLLRIPYELVSYSMVF